MHTYVMYIKACSESNAALSLNSTLYHYQPSLSSKNKLLSKAKGNQIKKITTLLRDQQTSVAGVGDDGNSHYLSHIHECA